MKKKLVLIDGHSILNRAYYGVPLLTNAAGLHTNAVYGFLNILFKILEEEQPAYLAVAFDVKEPTFRHRMYAAYKGTRKPMPEELREQVPVLKQLLQAMQIRMLELPGYEADDILGTMAGRAEREGIAVSLVSGDRDLLQIASDGIRIRLPRTKGGKTEVDNYYAEDVRRAYGITPQQFIEWKALVGDTSDNIPGVPKIGEKTATELLKRFASLEGIYTHLDEIEKKSVRESLRENRELADLSLALATIDTDIPLDVPLEELKTGDLYTGEAFRLCRELGLKQILSRFTAQAAGADAGSRPVEILPDARQAAERLHEAAERGAAGIFLLEEDGAFLGLALCCGEEELFWMQAGEALDRETCRTLLRELLDRLRGRGGRIACAQVKRCCRFLELRDPKEADGFFDILIAAYLLNPLKSNYAAEDVAQEYAGLTMPEQSAVLARRRFADALADDRQAVVRYAALCAYTAWKARPVLEERLKETGMQRLFDEIEMPLAFVLADMERLGVRVRREELRRYGESLSGEIQALEQEIYAAAGETFNLNSPRQLGEILFGKLGLPGGKKTRTGYSTAADVLEKLAPEAPIVEQILRYRGLAKLKSTYADGLDAYIEEDGRIHTHFNQTITATGRLSSTEPNLQNIPMRMEQGRQIRKVFVPEDGCVFLDADYSQIELRVLAHLSGDESLIEAYRSNADIHRLTASQVFGTPFEEVTDLQRRNAKAVNFGIVYGISSFGLSQDLSITRQEAAQYIEQYFAAYPRVRQFLDRLVAEAKQNGYVTTLFGRRRPVPELSSGSFQQRAFGERIAMNSPVQGTAADIIKIAMLRVYRALRQEGLAARLILQVHDELVLEAPVSEQRRAAEILQEQMRQAADLAVELPVDLHAGENWYEAK